MINSISLLAKTMNVTGAEHEMIAHIVSELKKKGLDPETDSLNSVYIRNKKFETVKLMICCPVDNPGFIALDHEDKKVFLFTTQKLSDKLRNQENLQNASATSYEILDRSEKNEYVAIEKDPFIIGEAFRFENTFSNKKNDFNGLFASRYALIQTLLDLSELALNFPISICFTTGFHSLSKSENCLAKRLCPECVLLLGSYEGKTLSLLVKDGKHFANKDLVKKIIESAKTEDLTISKKVSDKALTKAETIAVSGGTKVASLTLPCKNKGNQNETVDLRHVNELETLITSLVKTI